MTEWRSDMENAPRDGTPADEISSEGSQRIHLRVMDVLIEDGPQQQGSEILYFLSFQAQAINRKVLLLGRAMGISDENMVRLADKAHNVTIRDFTGRTPPQEKDNG